MTHRADEEDCIHFRSERFVQINTDWYFMTRESEAPIGPFHSHEVAERELRHYHKDLQTVANPTMMYRNFN